MADVSQLAVHGCGDLHSIGVTRLLRYTGLHPRSWFFAMLPFAVALAYSTLFRSLWSRTLGPAWLVPHPDVLLDAVCDPGAGGLLVVSASLLLSAFIAKPSTYPNGISGLLTGFSFCRFTSQPFLHSLLRIRVVDYSFPGGLPTHWIENQFQVHGFIRMRLRRSGVWTFQLGTEPEVCPSPRGRGTNFWFCPELKCPNSIAPSARQPDS